MGQERTVLKKDASLRNRPNSSRGHLGTPQTRTMLRYTNRICNVLGISCVFVVLAPFFDCHQAYSQGRLETTIFASAELSANKRARVYLPPSYDSSDKRYPVFYFLHGTGGSPDDFFSSLDADGIADGLIADGLMQEMIIVGVDGQTKYSVSYYVNSEVNGNHEDYVVGELVDHIDSKYRTLPQRNSRGIAGHSTGGYGALLYGMKYPDLFGAVYSFSGGSLCYSRPECVVFLGEDQAVFSDGIRSLFGDVGSNLAGVTDPSDVRGALRQEIFSMAAAFSPNLDNEPLLVDLPFELPSLTVVQDTRDKWFEHDLFALLKDHSQDLSSLNGLVLDVGDRDEIGLFTENEAFHEALLDAGVSHEFDVFSGGHNSRFNERITKSFEFFSNTLAASGQPACDFTGDGLCLVDDIDHLVAEIANGPPSSNFFDLDTSGDVDDADVDRWLLLAAEQNGYSNPYVRGDSNLDGTVNAADLNNLALNWRKNGAPSWSGGDFWANGIVDSTDLNALALNWRQSIPMASSESVAVPEPTAWLLMILGITLACRRAICG